MRSRLLVTVALAAMCVTMVVPAASGDGGPGAGVMQGWEGITSGAFRYVTVSAGGSTSLQAIRRDGGRVERFMALKGNWGIPMVAFDGSTAGLTRDGLMLMLAGARTTPELRKTTRFALVDVKRMRVIRTISVRGDHTFDALSPNGRYMYLVEYVSASDFNRYRVRAFDLWNDRLLPDPVIDKRETEAMQGAPVTRAAPRDSAWVYTLYGGPHETFIHALDTRHVGAICIDLWEKQPKRVFDFRMRLDGDGQLVVRGPRGRVLAVVDREAHRVVRLVRHP